MLVQRSLLLDVDGVVFRHREISGRVGQRTCDLVQKVLQCNANDAKKINKQLYSYYGHTYLGLKNIYKTQMSLREYNDFIYDPSFIESLMAIKPTPITLQAKKQTETVLANAMTKNVKCYFYSNAPYLWLQFVVNYLKPNVWIHSGNWLHSHHDIYDEDGALKPSTHNYTMTDYYLRRQTEWYANHEVLYVDDSNVNVWQPSVLGMEWKCYHLSQKKVVPQSSKLKQIKSLQQLVKEF